jgi:Tol biopolymer transport system component
VRLTCRFLAFVLSTLVVTGEVSAQTGGGGAGRAATEQFTTDAGVDIDATYTPDGKFVVYASSRTGSLELWMRPVGGGAVLQLTTSVNGSADRNPSLTADGQTVIFQSDRVNRTRNIWSLDLRTRAMSQLTSLSDGGSNPAVSSKGDICFTRSYASGNLAVWVMSGDGRNPRELGAGMDCAWTPSGGQILFSRSADARTGAGQYDLWIMEADGQSPRVLLGTGDSWERSPTVSPDGRTVVFTRYEGAFSSDLVEMQGGFQVRQGLRTALWSVPMSGGAASQLTEPTEFGSYASYAPDGKSIVFTSNKTGSADLWVLRPR